MLGYIKLNILQSLSEELTDSQVFELYFQAMARKRPVEVVESFEVESFDAVDKPVSSANIHGMITSLSPVK